MKAIIIYIQIAMVMSLLLLSGCVKETDPAQISLPPTPAFTNRQKWGVITASHLRLRQEPSIDAALVTTLWNPSRAVLEVLAQTSRKDTLEDLEGYWYQVTYDGLSGWVFGGYLEIVSSKEEALKRIRQLQ